MTLDKPAPETDEEDERSSVDKDASLSSSCLLDTSIVTYCIYKNDVQRFIRCFEEEENAHKETLTELLNVRDENGKTPLDVAAQFGRTEMVRELLQRGADITAVTDKGYCALHHAAAWGHIDVLKVMVDHGADLQQRNVHGERPRETAQRYNQTECMDFLDWAEARTNLVELIRTVQEWVTDPERAGGGRITKDEKALALNTCREKTDWLENIADLTTQDFITQREALDEIAVPILAKLAEPLPDDDKRKKKTSKNEKEKEKANETRSTSRGIKSPPKEEKKGGATVTTPERKTSARPPSGSKVGPNK